MVKFRKTLLVYVWLIGECRITVGGSRYLSSKTGFAIVTLISREPINAISKIIEKINIPNFLLMLFSPPAIFTFCFNDKKVIVVFLTQATSLS
jgi:hypothetical protein